MAFNKESDFETALIKQLQANGWGVDPVLKNYDEKALIRNWADILFDINNTIDRLNGCPLTDGEMAQIIEQIKVLKTPMRLNGFINGGSVSVKRDNPADTAHFGKEISLKIYDRLEIANGQSRYQIAQQPRFSTKSKIMNDRRGDLMLLINGMPVFHIELKKSGVPVSQAAYQIQKYAGEGIFSGLFSLVQIFVAMNPEETIYFANPGPEGKFNPDFYFHWADFNNEPINDWKKICASLLHIPLAHQMIGFYTIADDSDGALKVMRSYQYRAANAISVKVEKMKWDEKNQLGGYIWHTTGSGKTMTSFKSAQLIAVSKDADKVVFLMDRIELGTQSLKEYRNFAGAGLTEQQKANTVQETEDTHVLIGKLKSKDPANTLIVTSIQKMSNISNENEHLKKADLDKMNNQRLVFIIDEAHRSTFGEMLHTIKKTFPKAIFFGFTGTPIYRENEKKMNTTSTVFGDELHRYSIADGIRDKNVLGFDPYKVLTHQDEDVRREVGLHEANAKTVEEALSDSKKSKIFMKFMNEIEMVGHNEISGKYVKGIEDYLPSNQYRTDEHQSMVVKDIVKNWPILSRNHKFHAIFATNSIPEAVEYYRRFKETAPTLKVTALFDPNIDNNDGAKFKEDGLIELITDYNNRYGQEFTAATFQKMKKDIAARLAHKKPYERIEYEPDKEIDLLIVVDQMLTGFDSKWINTLYLDKVIQYESIIQAFSRTNRLFGPDKPFGTIKYYRKPHTMEKNIEKAVKLYSGDRPIDLFVPRLYQNLLKMNELFGEIKSVFEQSGVENFERLPDGDGECKQFASLFSEFNRYMQAAKVQGFTWDKLEYSISDESAGKKRIQKIKLELDETTYRILALRYKELFTDGPGPGPGPGGGSVPFDIEPSLLTIDTEKINADYMNSRFDKYLKQLAAYGKDAEESRKVEEELHKYFASLTREEQKYANIFLHDLQSGEVEITHGKTFMEYIVDYMVSAKDDQIHRLATALGLDESMLRDLMNHAVDEANIDDFGRFTKLKETADPLRAKSFFETKTGTSLPTFRVNVEIDKLLRDFILKGGYEIEGTE